MIVTNLSKYNSKRFKPIRIAIVQNVNFYFGLYWTIFTMEIVFFVLPKVIEQMIRHRRLPKFSFFGDLFDELLKKTFRETNMLTPKLSKVFEWDNKASSFLFSINLKFS